MPRHARIAVAGIPWHIIQRGNNRSACFFAEADYHYFLDTLAEQSTKWNCAVHAYVLMTNHVHLLLTPQECNSASNLMKHLGQRYVQYINRTYHRTGTLWEGRFRSCLAQNDTYVLTCYRYIELNPTRAGMVNNPANYRWSSYHVNALGEVNKLLTPHPDYLALGTSGPDRCHRYRALFETRLETKTLVDIRLATNGNFVLGNKIFESQIAATVKRRGTRSKPGCPKNKL
ncbi:Transposase and inactivated derivatives [hydrothermal vent metagenome]|uniref:Transposase and inactivated derivatives n=1 Tax=hydrothermal vent metagenome TaxID=652676 RepID=A0A3B1BP90_9ZZZZ